MSAMDAADLALRIRHAAKANLALDIVNLADQLLATLGPHGLHLLGQEPRTAELAVVVFGAHWPESLQANHPYRVACDDNRNSWLQVAFSGDGDAWVYVWEGDEPDDDESNGGRGGGVRIRTLMGGGRNIRTRQALLWLAEAIRRDQEGTWAPGDGDVT